MRGFVLREAADSTALAPMGEMSLVLVERGHLAVTTREGRRLEARAGAALVFVGGATWTSTPTAELVCITFPEPDAARLRAGLDGSFVLAAEAVDREPRLSALAALLRAEPQSSRASACLAEAFVWYARELRGGHVTTVAPSDTAVRRAIALVERGLDQRLSVDEIARAVGLSRAAFGRRFREATGQPPDRYFSALRLQRAATRLQIGDESLAEIARDIGYASEFAFSRAFKRRYGIAPGTYRKQWRGLSRGLCEPLALAA